MICWRRVGRFISLASLVLVAALALAGVAEAQAPSLFRAVPGGPAAATSGEPAERLAKVRANPTLSSVEVVGVATETLGGPAVALDLPGVGRVTATKSRIVTRGSADYTWLGDVPGAGGKTILVVRDGQVTGTIWSGTTQFSVTPIGGGLHALGRVDPNAFPPDHTSPPRAAPQPPKRSDAAPAAASPDPSAPPVQVDVLIAYTSSAATAYGGDMAAFAQLAVDAANVAYTNSNAGVTLRLVGAQATPYSEAGKDFGTVLDDLTDGADANMVALRASRDALGADMATILINNTSACGVAWLVSSAATAFSVVHYSCAVGNHSYAHELGHNFGARHDPFVDPTTSPYPYGHGYVVPTNAWRTVMAYVNACGSCPRLQYFSNPDVSYLGTPMGTTATHDNARVHRERVATVAAFRNPPVAGSNDNLADATTISGAAGTASGSTATATRETGEPVHFVGTTGAKSAWWRWTAPSTGQATIDTVGSGFDTALAVYTGTTVAGLTQIVSNNDWGGAQSRVSFHATAGQSYAIAVDGANAGASGAVTLNWSLTTSQGPAGLVAAVLPYARSVQVGTAATAFASIINATGAAATRCSLQMPSSQALPGVFQYQTATPANTLSGTVNTPVDIAAGATQQFVLGFTPSAAFTATDIGLVFDCESTQPVASFAGLNTFLLSASATPVPDMVAIGATPTANGILDVPPAGAAFAAAAINIGAAGSITATLDTGAASLPLTVSICQTNPSTGACLAPAAASTTATLANNEVATYAVFASATGTIALDPAANRLFLRLSSGGVTRGATSVAVRTVAAPAPAVAAR